MASVGRANTRPEKMVRKALFADGFRFRLHASALPGRPDIVLPRFKIAVFVNGCFWHGHQCARGRRPRSNTEYWNRKLDANLVRDARAQEKLRQAGWVPVLLWSCELATGTAELLTQLRRARDDGEGLRSKSRV